MTPPLDRVERPCAQRTSGAPEDLDYATVTSTLPALKSQPTGERRPWRRPRVGAGRTTAECWGGAKHRTTEGVFEKRISARLHLAARRDVTYRETENLRVLIANERKDRLALVAPIVAALGHEVIAREIDVADVGAVTARERPDVALVGLGESSDHALGLIEKIVREAACPVIVLLHAPDPSFVKEASKRGVFAYITDRDATEWQSSIDIVLRRFAEYHDLEGAFGRRALTERAKGILMERHSVDDEQAFGMLREHARTTNRKLVDVASAVVDGHRLLPKHPTTAP
jgi:AmiR/NasT family two-component response regulator